MYNIFTYIMLRRHSLYIGQNQKWHFILYWILCFKGSNYNAVSVYLNMTYLKLNLTLALTGNEYEYAAQN